ncbi:hypothetical protein [Aquabacterium sp. OR-4]|uniref:hypothetical protein n=1 Tax=Aquabacterium sp. OR-4 TaxID=2978127 RepID=UPI0028C6CE48|nr:hypothetical protein [Aquabacterium sp. OR-4]MDT7834119.1 hypothetical protein [Aquabacterium sp. OR-4]
MLEVFKPVPWAEFCGDHIDRLSSNDLARGFTLRFRWVLQRLCVTAVYAPAQTELPPAPGEAMDLHVAPGSMADVWGQIRGFAETEVQRQHALHPFYERVAEHGRVHLARPFRSTALCKKRAAHWDSAAGRDMTCRICIRRASVSTRMQDPAFKHITVSHAERVRARLRLTPDPMFELLFSALDDTLARQRGGRPGGR